MNQSEGIGFLDMLAIVFIALKLGEVGVVAGWSWWAVLMPIWLPILFWVALVFCLILLHSVKRSKGK